MSNLKYMYFKYILLIIFFTSCLLSIVYTQTISPRVEWIARYNSAGTGDDYVNDMIVDSSGNVYLTGYKVISGNNKDYLTIKYNTAGEMQWAKSYDGPVNGEDVAVAIALDKLGNVIVTGHSQGGLPFNLDYLTIKYTGDGEVVWIQRYYDTSNTTDMASAIDVDDSGNVYVTGYSYQTAQNGNYATVKYNPDGFRQWVAFYNNTQWNGFDWAQFIKVKNDAVYVTGRSVGDQFNEPDAATIKYDLNGVQHWVRRYGIVHRGESPSALEINDSGDAFVAIHEPDKNVIIKYNAMGDSIWLAEYPGGEVVYEMKVNGFSNIYTTGQGGILNSSDFTTKKIDLNGNLLWKMWYPYNLYQSTDIANSVTTDRFGNVYVTGYNDSNWLVNDYMTIRYNSKGILQWAVRYSNSYFADDRGIKVRVDYTGNVYVTGISAGFGYDIATIKYAQDSIIGISPVSTEIPGKFMLYQNYPNPFNPQTSIPFSVPEYSDIKISIYDVLGREIAVQVNEKLKPGNYETVFNASNIPSGVYFYNIRAGTYRESKKMVLVK